MGREGPTHKLPECRGTVEIEGLEVDVERPFAEQLEA
jgi:hypothetical protein